MTPTATATTLASLAIGAPEIVLAAGTCVLLLVGVFRGDRALGGLTLGAVILLGLAAASIAGAASPRLLAWGGLYVADNLAAFAKLLLYAAVGVALVLAVPALRRTPYARFEYPVLVLLATIGMSLLVSAHDFMTVYVGLELLSLASYVLASIHRDDARSTEAGLKYFVLGALASGLLLYGMSLLYGFTGSTNFAAVRVALAAEGGAGVGALVGLVFLVAGVAFKLAAVPFHMWTPDVYEGAPAPVAAFFASAPKVAAAVLLVRLLYDPLAPMLADWRQIVIFLALASMALGALGAIAQNSLRRLLAYSSINNIGFALVGVAAGTATGVSAVLTYMAVYVVMTLGAFLCVVALVDSDGRPVDRLDRLAGLRHDRPWLASALAVFMLSLAGLPPLFGFLPKLAVFNAAIEAGLVGLAVAGVLLAVLGAYYYLRMVRILFLDAPVDRQWLGMDRGHAVLMGAAAAVSSPLGWLLVGPLLTASAWAAASLF